MGKDPQRRFAFLAGNTLPTEQVHHAIAGVLGLEGAQSFLDYMGSSLNPVFSTGVQVGVGREFFSDRTIGPSQLDADLSIPEFVSNQFRPFREVIPNPFTPRKPALQSAAGKGPAQFAARLALGGRVQDFSRERTDRHLLRGFQDREKALRSGISLAERENDRSLSLVGRARLLSLYREMLGAGFEKEVPAWAREQLAQVSG